MSKLTPLTTKVDPQTREALEKACEVLGISSSELVRRLICDFVHHPDLVNQSRSTDLELLGRVKVLEKKLTAWERGLGGT